ncbi:TetR/AcrR family transcriptional regulator [Caulobacter sp. 602-1]|nr:TetR/AcrR family transcriptional regulator [Caulobacter sp. 602-1]
MDSIPNSGMALRARGKARRYAEIVGAAADLWREHGLDKVSLSQIAAAAEVSPQTIYNLIGGLDAVGLAVINVAMNRVESLLSRASAKGVAFALEAARASAQLYIDDSHLYRQVLVRIPRVLFEGTHLGRDVAQIVIQAMIQAQAAGEIASHVDPDRLGRVIYANYLGAIYDWACGDASDEVFLETSQVAVLAPAAACATDAARPGLTAQLYSMLRCPNAA